MITYRMKSQKSSYAVSIQRGKLRRKEREMGRVAGLINIFLCVTLFTKDAPSPRWWPSLIS